MALALFAVLWTNLFGSLPAAAHAFGSRYALPLPLKFYLVGAGAAVALSFVIMAITFRSQRKRADRPWSEISDIGLVRALSHLGIITVGQRIAVGLFLLVGAAGLFGSHDTTKSSRRHSSGSFGGSGSPMWPL